MLGEERRTQDDDTVCASRQAFIDLPPKTVAELQNGFVEPHGYTRCCQCLVQWPSDRVFVLRRVGKKHVEVLNRGFGGGAQRTRPRFGRTRSDGIAERQPSSLLELLFPVRELLSRDSLGFLVPILRATANPRENLF